MFINIINVEHVDGYKLRLQFDNGVEKEVDLNTELQYEIHQPLKNVDYFKRVFVSSDNTAIEWPNGAEFDADFLYEIGHELHKM